MVRGNGWIGKFPYDPSFCGGATLHPSACSNLDRKSGNVFVTMTQTLGQHALNEIKVGLSNISSSQNQIVPGSPQINLAGYRIGGTSYMPLMLQQNTPHLRDDFTTVFSKGGRHELKLGGEFLNLHTDVTWSVFRFGQIDANLRAVPAAALQSLFPARVPVRVLVGRSRSPPGGRGGHGGKYPLCPSRPLWFDTSATSREGTEWEIVEHS